MGCCRVHLDQQHRLVEAQYGLALQPSGQRLGMTLTWNDVDLLIVSAESGETAHRRASGGFHSHRAMRYISLFNS